MRPYALVRASRRKANPRWRRERTFCDDEADNRQTSQRQKKKKKKSRRKKSCACMRLHKREEREKEKEREIESERKIEYACE